MMKYVVTGGAGFIGSNLVDRLVSQNHEVHVIDNFISGQKQNCNKSAIYHKYDISDTKNNKIFIKIMKGASIVFHTAALARVQLSILEPIKYETNNTLGTINILKAAVEAKVKRLVYSASSSAYGDSSNLPLNENQQSKPLSPYAAQKYYGEIYCQMFTEMFDIETVCLRYFNVFGENQNLGGPYATVVGIFLNQLEEGKPMTIFGDGKNKRDYTYVGDVIDANMLASESPNVGNGEIINIGTGTNISVNELAELIGEKKVYLKAIREPKETLADITKAKSLLNWTPKVRLQDWIHDYKKTKKLK